MWTFEKAECLISLWADLHTDGEGAVVHDATIAKRFGWAFSYQSKEWIKSRDADDLWIGTSTLIFDRFSGEIVVKGSWLSIEQAAAEYEATLPPSRLSAPPEGRRSNYD